MTDHVAGPELDRLVAERVMSWAEDPKDRGWFSTGARGRVFYERTVMGDPVDPEDACNPSTRIDHAWEVVEKLLNDDSDRDFTLRVSGRTSFALFHHYRDTPFPDAMCADNSAPLAICLAALRAVGVEG